MKYAARMRKFLDGIVGVCMCVACEDEEAIERKRNENEDLCGLLTWLGLPWLTCMMTLRKD